MPPTTSGKVKSAIGKKEIKRLGNRKKSKSGGNEDRQEEDTDEVLSDWEGDDMSAAELEADPPDERTQEWPTSGSPALP